MKQKATLKLENGKEITVEIDKKELEKLEKPFPQKGDAFWFAWGDGGIGQAIWRDMSQDHKFSSQGNVFETEQEAKDLVRARALVQAIKVRRKELNGDWEPGFARGEYKYSIRYSYYLKEFEVIVWTNCILSDYFGYCKDEESAQTIIDEFHDDLIWYFTEYIPEVN